MMVLGEKCYYSIKMMKLIQILKEIKLHTPGIPRTNEDLLILMNSNLDKVADFIGVEVEAKSNPSDNLNNYRVDINISYELDSRQNIIMTLEDGVVLFSLDLKTFLLYPEDEEVVDTMNIFGFPVFYLITSVLPY